MEDIKRILVVSRMSRYCRKAVHYGVSLAHKFGAELYVIHTVHSPLVFGAWNLPRPSIEDDYKKEIHNVKKELDAIINAEKIKGLAISEIIREGEPTKDILDTVEKEKIDLIVMLAHEEWRLEHFLFGRSTEEVIRKMPCSVLLVKEDLSRPAY
ncbi:MAG TPA: universal stress protein [Dissulfurispiraceae bacterium]|nr:universal stress protein [Dissulfurispiraceae bacterium]